MIGTIFRKLVGPIASRLFPVRWKEYNELRYWRGRKREEGALRHDHYQEFYTTHFGLSKDDYEGLSVLDLGCGPRGSLEWADGAARRVGLDPLAAEYLALGAAQHAMEYVSASSEDMPFGDEAFDVVCSFNSLDHVASVELTVGEIKRVLKPGGLFLLLSDVGHDPTPMEPQTFSWEIVEAFEPELELVEMKKYEKVEDGMYPSLRRGVPYDESDLSKRYGILSAKMRKRPAAS